QAVRAGKVLENRITDAGCLISPDQAPSAESLLGAPDRLISSVVQHEDHRVEAIRSDRQQLLGIELNAAVASYEDGSLARSSDTGTDERGHVPTHGPEVHIRQDPLALGDRE